MRARGGGKNKRGYSFLSHTADIKARVWGETLPQCAEEAIIAMQAAMFGGHLPALRRRGGLRVVRVAPSGGEALLVDLLNAVLAEADARDEVYPEVKVEGGKRGWRVLLRGGKPARRPRLEVKAATYSALKLERARGRWVAEVVFDV